MSRALRRHHADRAFARRLRSVTVESPMGEMNAEWVSHRIMHWHLRCNCFEYRARRARRRQELREWRQLERSAW